jgi:hypothetical protein
VKYPEIFDAVIPWAAFAWLWHLSWEFVLESDDIKGLISSAKSRWGIMWWTWLIVFVVGGTISTGYWYLVKTSLTALALEHNKSAAPAVGNSQASETAKPSAAQPTGTTTVLPPTTDTVTGVVHRAQTSTATTTVHHKKSLKQRTEEFGEKLYDWTVQKEKEEPPIIITEGGNMQVSKNIALAFRAIAAGMQEPDCSKAQQVP